MKDKEGGVLKDRILGCLVNLAIGDALGYPAHEMSQEEIKRRFNGPLRDFHPPFVGNPYHTDMAAGQVTDDTIMTCVIADAVADATGVMDARYFGTRIAEWARENRVWETTPMFGPTTKVRLKRLIEGDDPVSVGTSGVKSTDGATNGAAMRVAPAGLVNPGGIQEAVELAVQASLPTHGTQVAISAAAAVAAGVSEALREGSSVYSVVSASIRGAREGKRIARELARTVPAPDVGSRIETGVAACLKASDVLEACGLITDAVGNGMMAYETVPAAVSLFVASGGDPWLAVFGGANIGGDTDTIASIAGALAGAFGGIEKVDRAGYERIERVNSLGLETIAEKLVRKVRRAAR
ncbi:MAG: ADP-ribosylglycohydrolase family protein [Spirochaetes bacterium]|nr:ADP-ribosylglycohydrolase family protein [Spirochaetota bacterium]